MFTLRDYQEGCLTACAAAARKGIKRMLIALPTGTGKTVIFSRVPDMIKDRRRMLVVAHRKELLDQSAEKIQLANPEIQVAVEQAEREADPDSQVIVASIQTLAVSPSRLERLRPDDFAVLVIDEAHHAPATSYLKLLHRLGLGPDPFAPGQTVGDRRKAFKTFKPADTAPFLLGFTATPNRTDGVGLEAIFDEIAYTRTIEEMIKAGWLCKIVGKRVSTVASLEGVKISDGDFQEGALAKAVNLANRNELAVKSYLSLAAGRRCLVFCVDVQHTLDMTEAFKNVGVSVDMVVGSTPKEQRDAIIANYKRGIIPVLANCMVLTEGFDAPETSCIIMARPTKSQLLYTQMMGRGTRIAPGKENLLVIDLVDAGAQGVADLNDLFGLPPGLDTDDDVITSQEKVAEAAAEAAAHARTLEEIKDLAKDFNPLGKWRLPTWFTGGLRWSKTTRGYALFLKGGAVIAVKQNLLGQCGVTVQPKTLPGYVLGMYETEAEAITAAEILVVNEFTDQVGLLAADAPWHDDLASEKQKARLTGWNVPIPPGLTKIQASELMDKKLRQFKAWGNRPRY